MPRKPRLRQCMRCGHVNPGVVIECSDCGTPLIKKRFKMTPARIKYVHTLAYKQKGLSEDEYRIVLESVGVSTCKEMKERHYIAFVRKMRQQPNAGLL